MKHTTKRILVLLLALLMALPAVSFAAASETEIVARGKYNAKISWTLDTDGTLTITGNGYLDGYSGNISSNSISPWCGDSRIKTVVVSTGVKSVGAGAFLNCENLKTVVLPESLTRVYSSAFYGCGALQYVFFAGSEAKWDQIWTDTGSISFPRLTFVGSFPLPVPYDSPLCNADIRFGVADWGCEDDVVWVYDNTKTLTFTGSGAIPNYPAAAPWSSHTSEGIRRIVLEQGITDARGIGLIPENTEELIVLNPACDISALQIEEPTFLRGYLGSTAENYADDHAEDCLFLPLCPADHRHTVVPDAGCEPTLSSEGYSEGLYCVDCGAFFYGHLRIPALTGSGAEDTVVDEDGEVETAYAMTGFIAWLAKLLEFFRNL